MDVTLEDGGSLKFKSNSWKATLRRRSLKSILTPRLESNLREAILGSRHCKGVFKKQLLELNLWEKFLAKRLLTAPCIHHLNSVMSD